MSWVSGSQDKITVSVASLGFKLLLEMEGLGISTVQITERRLPCVAPLIPPKTFFNQRWHFPPLSPPKSLKAHGRCVHYKTDARQSEGSEIVRLPVLCGRSTDFLKCELSSSIGSWKDMGPAVTAPGASLSPSLFNCLPGPTLWSSPGACSAGIFLVSVLLCPPRYVFSAASLSRTS